MVHHTERQRWLAVVAYFKSGSNFRLAVTEFQALLSAEEFQDFPAPGQFIRDCVSKFNTSKDMSDQYSGRTASHSQVVPDEVVKDCSTELKGGYLVQVPGKDKDGKACSHPVHRYYRSINQACRENSYLASVVAQFHVTPQHLLRRMHQVDPNLVMRVAEFKHDLTAEQRLERQQVAAQLLQMWQHDNGAFLGTCWVDETTVWVVSSGDHREKVWCDAHDAGVRAVFTSPHLGHQNEIKLHMLGGVSAVPSARFCEFTTGTTDLQRLHIHPPGPYKVSHT